MKRSIFLSHPILTVALSMLGAACGGERSPDAGGGVTQAASALTPSDPNQPLPIALPEVADPLLSNLTIPSTAPQKGMWSATQAWPINGLHSVLLPNGRVLTYGTPSGAASTQNGRTFDVWDPAQGWATVSHQTTFNSQQIDSFCSSASFLPDGRLMVSGGSPGFTSTLFTVATNATATASPRLADERWYASMINLADGRPLMLGGSKPFAAWKAYEDPAGAINAGNISMTPEVLESSGWRSLFGAMSRDAFGPDFNRYWYPRAWVAPNGEVFGISSEKMWYLNPAGNGSVRVAGNYKTGVNNTTKPNVGPTSAAVMFAPGRILQMGGNGYRDRHETPSSALATVIDINGGNPVLSETAAMSFARQWPSAVVLPDGRVVVTGGTRQANNGGSDAVYEAEIWNPGTGTWTTGARAAQIRVYHSATILMPNGTVLSTGGGAPGPVNNLNAEIYYPPYLFRTVGSAAQLAPRPVLTAINALKFSHGAQVDLDLGSASPIAKVVLLGTSSVTHSFNTSQRYQELTFLQNGTRLSADMPANGNLAPPGYYLLVAVDSAGVPSSGVIVAVGSNTVPPPVPSLLPRGRQITLYSASDPNSAIATDPAGLGVLKVLGSNPSSADLASAQFVVRDGLANSSCVSLESTATPGQWLRQASARLRLGTNDGSATFKNDATYCPEAGLAGTGVTLRSVSLSANVIRHRSGQIWLDPGVNDSAFALSATFTTQVAPEALLPAVAAPLLAAGTAADYAPAVNVPGGQYSWDFGDGSPATPFASSPNASHTFTNPGVYLVTLTLNLPDGDTGTKTFVQAVYSPPTASAAGASSATLLEPRGAAAARLWVVNPDNDSVSVFDTGTNTRTAEITVGTAPRSVGLAPDGRVWVVNRGAASISIVSPSTLTVAATVALPRGSQPHGLVVAPDGLAAYLTLEGTGTVLKLNPTTGSQLASLVVGGATRQLSITGDSTRLLVSRFITPPLPGEATSDVQTSSGGIERGGEVVLVNANAMTVSRTIVLRNSDAGDGPVSGNGIPNYLGPAVVSPDGRSAWVPSKQDNVQRGTLRSGLNLDFQNTVRAISSRINLDTEVEDYAGRVDHDNSSLASGAAFHPQGTYLFVALETSRQVAVMDAVGKHELFRVDVGQAPQSLVVSLSGKRLYVQNFMDRTVSVLDLDPLVSFGEFRAPVVATIAGVGTEKLSPQVLTGKKLFYDARDTRLARDAYLSCATCHNDGGQDGRVWDLTGRGEGLRNTIGLRGRAGGQSLLHWSGNFDEVQDFEGQIRTLSGGTGLMTDADYNAGTRSQPLGDPKAGRSADLDALAAYVTSLSAVAPSPFRNSDGTLTSAAAAGRIVFGSAGCPTCHNGSSYSNEGSTSFSDIGTIQSSSGGRLGGPLTGIDTPSLRDAWATAPYLHNGSAGTIEDAIAAHDGVNLSATDLGNLAAFVQQIDATEPGFTVPCGTVNGVCPVFSDNFEDGDSLDWTRHDGTWSVLTDGSTKVYQGTSSSGYARSSAGSATWTTQSVEARIKPVAWPGSNTNRFAVLAARFVNVTNYYYVAIRQNQTIELRKLVNNAASTVVSPVPFTFTVGTSYKVRLEAIGSSLKVYVDDVLRLSGTDSTFTAGKIAVGAFNGTISFDEIVVTGQAASTAPSPASNPSPGNNATGVSTTPTLTWTAGAGATTHDVYFGAGSSPQLVGNQTGTSFAPPQALQPSTLYSWRVIERNSAGVSSSTVWQFTTVGTAPSPASNPSPGNNATGVSTTPTLTWTAGAGATTHDVYFGAGSSPQLVGNQTGTSFAPPQALQPSTLYSWRVIERNSAGVSSSTVWQFTTAGTAPSPASNPSPGNNATGVSTTPTLTWTAGAGATTHDVYFGELNSPNSPAFVQNQLSSAYVPGPLAASTTYLWRVVQRNMDGVSTSTTWQFTTAGTAPSPATNPSPASNSIGVSATPTLTWTAGAGATSHDVYFGTSGEPPFVQNQAGTSFVPPQSLTASTPYFWKIVERNAAGSSSSAVWQFTTASPGTTLFTDNFEDGDSAGWTRHDGTWSVLLDGTTRVYQGASNSGYARVSAGLTSWTAQSVEARIKVIAWTGSSSNRFVVLAARVRDINNYYYVAIRQSNTIELRKLVNNSPSTIVAPIPLTVSVGTSYKVRLEAIGTSLKVYVNDVLRLSGTDSSHATGKIAIGTFNSTVSFDDIIVK